MAGDYGAFTTGSRWSVPPVAGVPNRDSNLIADRQYGRDGPVLASGRAGA